ncbi:Lactose permease [Rhizoctonia solani AG-1 IB]|uniref:Lactose permease n=1 Tax=Thanatephorus cucumeris (strain AG1-IB / isolate 7/3/14) TaxID=1108050 RepID=M5CAY1_THACB|nr:Lactose permease [Rhizoctonia solani AG-1 IB]
MAARTPSPIDEKKDSEIFSEHSPQKAELVLLSDEERDRAIVANPINPRSWRSIQLYLICIVAYCNSGSTGLDGTLFGGINAMDHFHTFIGAGKVGSEIGIIITMYPIGQIIGCLFAAPVMDRFGRKGGMICGSFIVLIGTLLLTASQNKAMFMVGRLLSGTGVAVAANAAPSYVTEMSPPQWRGRMGGMYNSWYYVGAILITGIMVASGRINSGWQWRLPVLFQALPAGIVFTFVWFIPESPRWLVRVGRDDQARAILTKYHGNGDENSPLVDFEMKEIKAMCELDGSDQVWWDMRPLFRTAADRYRSYMCLGMATFGQLSGNGLITYFFVVLLQNAGITSANSQLVLNFVMSVVSFGGACTGVSLLDKVGRRPLMMFSTTVGAICLAVVSACTARYEDSKAIAQTGVAFIFLFNVLFSLGFTPLQPLYPAECLTFQTRAKGMAMTTLVLNLASLFNTYAIPVALEKIGWKTYLVFVAWDIFETICIYFFAVETKQKTLEEMAEIFEAPNPVKASLKRTSKESHA